MEERQRSTGILLILLILAISAALALRVGLFPPQREGFGIELGFAHSVPTLMATATPGLAVPTPRPYVPPPTPAPAAPIIVQGNSGGVTINNSTTNVDVDICVGYCP